VQDIPLSIEGQKGLGALRAFFSTRMAGRHELSLASRRAAFQLAIDSLGLSKDRLDSKQVLIADRTALLSTFVPEGQDIADVVYFHGGAFVSGSPFTHLHFTSLLSQLSYSQVFSIDYSLAPEHPYPAALNDAVAAFKFVSDRNPLRPVFLAGDSAGGNLALACAHRLREENLSPAGLILLSPFVDLTMGHASSSTRSNVDPFLTTAGLEADVARYVAERHSLRSPEISPLYARHDALPSVFLQVGTDEILFEENIALVTALRQAGVDVHGEIWDGMVHNWHLFPNWLPEASEATLRIANFIRSKSQPVKTGDPQ
jgi:monoterpene epsilon-lactone hydrolase